MTPSTNVTLIRATSACDRPVRLVRGAAVPRDEWAALDRLEQRRLLVRA